jgi:1,4-alpha-glucan branching enzyme
MYMKFKIILISFVLFSISVFPQIVVTVPATPTENDSITVYFDATQDGAEELLNYTGTVYAHTGVTTNLQVWGYVIGDWGNNTNQPALTRDSTNHYHLTIGYPRTFYGITNPSEHIQTLNFVFRSADAEQQTRPDIFIDIYEPGLTLLLNTPELDLSYDDPKRSPVFAGPIDTVNISLSCVAIGTETSSIDLYYDGIFAAHSDTNELFSQFFASNYTTGFHTVTAVAADTAGITDTLAFLVMIHPPAVNLPLPAGNVHGINYTSSTSVTLALYAPYKDFVYVIGDFNDWKVDSSYYMYKDEVTPDSVIWWLTINNLTPGAEYGFQYLVDGSIRVGDPYSEKVLDQYNDPYISDTTYPNLKPYPTGKTSELVSVFETDQQPYQWQVTNFEKPAKQDLVIYELLIRDFVSTHDYKTLKDTLGYLKRLGINAVELMPVMEFEGNESWGYNPSFQNALDKYYGPKNDLKSFVDEAHSMGIAVILDIVLNHAYGQCPLVRLYFDKTTGRVTPENPWFNVFSPNPVYSWGYDFNHESSATRYFVDRINKYWLTEYHVDGFRFDFTKGFTNTPGEGWNYDPARIAILERMADKVWETDSSAYVILEHFTANQEEIELSDYGMMVWGNINCAYSQATMGYPSGPCGTWDFSWVSYIKRNWNNPYLVGYMESHDEQRLMYKNLTWGNSSGDYNIKNLYTAIQRNKEAAAFFFTVPGPKMIWQFGELGYDISIDDPCRMCPKPILWNYYDDPARLKLYKVFKTLINLKKDYPAFRSSNFSIDAGGNSKRINIIDSTMDVTVIGNFNVQPSTYDPNFSGIGTWYDYFSGDSITVSDPHASLFLLPGEFHIYTTVKLPTPEEGLLNDVVNTGSQVVKEFRLEQNFPNPFNPTTEIRFNVKEISHVVLKIYDVLGREVKTLVNKEINNGQYRVTWQGDNNAGQRVSSGIYLYRMEAVPVSGGSGKYIQSKKMLLIK